MEMGLDSSRALPSLRVKVLVSIIINNDQSFITMMTVSTTSEVYEILKDDDSIHTLLDRDPDSEIVVHKLEGKILEQLRVDFPELFNSLSTPPDFIFSVNGISSRMFDGKSYLKIKIYVSDEGTILKKIVNF